MAFVNVATLTAALGVGDLYPDATMQEICDAANAIVATYVDADAITDEPAPVKEAALTLAIDIWQSRQAPNGQMAGVDFAPSPYRMGRALVGKIQGLLAPYYNIDTLVG